MKFVWLTIIFFVAAPCGLFADAAGDFAKANQEYAAGHFQKAGEGYAALVRAGQSNPALFYNLANAYYRRGDLARAILNYERVLALDPHQAEAAANLQLVRDQARALELTAKWPERILDSLSADWYAWIAAAGFWIGIFALVMFCFRRSTGRVLAMIIAFLLCGGALYALYIVENGSRGESLAIVTRKNVDARLATADNAGSVLALPAGSEIKILSTRGDWSYAALPNDLRGWIPTKSAESVRL